MGASPQPHHPNPPPRLPEAGGTGQGCARHRLQRAQWVLVQSGVSARPFSCGEVVATRAAVGGLRGAAEPAPDAQEGAGPCSATASPHGYQQPLNGPKPWCWGVAPGAPLCWQAQPGTLLLPALPGVPPGGWHRAGGRLWPRSPLGLLHGAAARPALGLLLWVTRVQLASSLRGTAGPGRGRSPYLLGSHAGPRLGEAGKAHD